MEIDQVSKQKYLGFVISNQGNNLANIQEVKNKSIGIIKKILEKLNNLNLKKYYFECGLIFMNVVLRGTILYAAETYYNLTEKELRILERIEESYMRKLFKTTAGCPVVQLYLELSQIPARFAIMKARLLFLKSILHENAGSRIAQFVKLQFEERKKGDWILTCIKDLKVLGFTGSLEEIKAMKKNQYKTTINKKIREIAFKYLLEKQRSKGKNIIYEEFCMADYLLPNDNLNNIEDQRYLFSIRNRMINIPSNFGKEAKCICGEIENMLHIYNCRKLNKGENLINFEKIYNGKLTEQVTILKKFRNNMEVREKFIHVIASRSTNHCKVFSNGNT